MPFYDRLVVYYAKVAEVLQGQASAASIFPNAADLGDARERIYARVLRQHLPSSSNVLFGGYLFGLDGSESKQIDIIITSGLAPQFNLDTMGGSKSFACVDGCIGVVSVKSTLTGSMLSDCLTNLASIPDKRALQPWQTMLEFPLAMYEEWPYKIVCGLDAAAPKTIETVLSKFYADHPSIPPGKRPNLIHVPGRYVLHRNVRGQRTIGGRLYDSNDYLTLTKFPDAQGFLSATQTMQAFEFASHLVNFDYSPLIAGVVRAANLPADMTDDSGASTD